MSDRRYVVTRLASVLRMPLAVADMVDGQLTWRELPDGCDCTQCYACQDDPDCQERPEWLRKGERLPSTN